MLIKGRTHGAHRLFVEMPDEHMREPDRIYPWLEPAQTNELSHKCLANKPLPAGPTDFAVAAHPAHGVTPSVLQFGQLARKFPATLAIPLGGHGLPQRLARSVVVVMVQPAGGAVLLALARSGGGRGGFPLHHPMKLFVRAIGLWTGRPGKLHPDAQPHPPGTQLRKPRRAARSKRTALVHPHYVRQAATLKQPCKDGLDGRRAGLIQAYAAKIQPNPAKSK